MDVDTTVFSIKDKIAIVTGAGMGIGRGIALEYARAGARLVVADIVASTVESTAAKIRELGGEVITIVGDVTDKKQVEKLIEKTIKKFDTIDILVNNVGGVPKFAGSTLADWDIREEECDKLINLNLKPTILCTRAAVKVMVEQKKGGSIINLASIAGTIASPSIRFSSYGASKAGIINFTLTASQYLGKYGIRVNAIAPGRIETESSAADVKTKEEYRRLIPLGRLGNPQDIGRVAIFLASDAASYITGTTILVTGGLTHHLHVIAKPSE